MKEKEVFAQVNAYFTTLWLYECSFAVYGTGNVLHIPKHEYQRTICSHGIFVHISKTCPDPGLNQGPSDLQSDALPTELSGLYIFFGLSCSHVAFVFINKSIAKQNPNFVKFPKYGSAALCKAAGYPV